MSKSISQEDFNNKIYDLVNDEYDVVGNYINAKTKIDFRHNLCGHIFSMRPDAFTSGGQRCPKCNGKVKYTTSSFIEEINKRFPNEYLIKSNFIDMHTKIFVMHKCGYEWNVNPESLKTGKAYCPRCSKKEKLSTKSFIKKLNNISNEYEVVGEYTNANTNIDVIHKKCGNKLSMRPSILLNGGGCIYCYGNIKKSNNEFIKEINQLTNNEYVCLDKYINAHTKIKFLHKKCNLEFYVNPSNFLQGTRCPFCNESKGEQKIRSWLDKNNINYECQKTFEYLFGLKGGNLSFDFYIKSKNLLIEYQGQFHDNTITGSYKKDFNFEIQKEHDKRKREYAENNNINLLEIWYWDFDNIENILREILKD